MKQSLLRITGVLILLITLYAVLLGYNPRAGGISNLFEVANRQGFFGVITLGVGVLIVAGGIDLSIGSVIGLGAVGFGLMMYNGIHPIIALLLTVAGGSLIGLCYGMIVTRLRVQAFLVTLCGLFIFRGLARYLTSSPVGLGRIKNEQPEFATTIDTMRFWLVGEDPERGLVFPGEFVVMLILAAVIGLFLHFTVFGRYWYAIGHNEQAARYSGINVDFYRVVVFMLCSACAAFGGVLWLLYFSDANPETAGQSYELYAITGAVLGGCSLRGGEGTAIGMVLGAMVLPVLDNLVIFLGIRDAIVPSVIGLTLLLGVLADEFFRRGASLLRRVRGR
jgi:ribose transport system permease protein